MEEHTRPYPKDASIITILPRATPVLALWFTFLKSLFSLAEMAPELFDLTKDSPPASPTIPQPTSSTTAAASSPAVMQNQHQPQVAQPLPKKLRISEPAIDPRKPNEAAPVGPMRSSSESNVSGSGTKPKYSYYRLRGSLSKVHLTDRDRS